MTSGISLTFLWCPDLLPSTTKTYPNCTCGSPEVLQRSTFTGVLVPQQHLRRCCKIAHRKVSATTALTHLRIEIGVWPPNQCTESGRSAFGNWSWFCRHSMGVTTRALKFITSVRFLRVMSLFSSMVPSAPILLSPKVHHPRTNIKDIGRCTTFNKGTICVWRQQPRLFKVKTHYLHSTEVMKVRSLVVPTHEVWGISQGHEVHQLCPVSRICVDGNTRESGPSILILYFKPELMNLRAL